MKNKKKDKNDFIKLDDTNEIKIEENIEKKTNKKNDKKENISKSKVNNHNKKDTLKDNNFFNEKQDKINKNNYIISNILLIISLGIFFYLCYRTYPSLDFNNFNSLIQPLSFLSTIFVVIIVLFKVNTKKTTPYILIITILLIIYTFFNTSYSIKDTYVQDFIFKDITEVIKFTDKHKLELNILHEYSDTVPKNHVIMQEYGTSTLIKDIKTFNVTISDGPNYDKQVVVTNLTGFKYDDVMKYIKDNNLNNIEIEFIKSDLERDTLIEQIGSGTLKRNDLIKFIFSYGSNEIEKIPVKDLKNLSLFEATSYLKRYNILYEIKYDYSDIEKDYVIDQDIINEIVEDKLILTISKGKEVIIPDFKKMNNLEITKWAMENNIEIEYNDIFDKDSKAGDILEVNKTIGDKIDENSKLIITISKGSMIMPNIDDLSKFKLWANENNIRFEENYEFSNNISAGELIKTNYQTGDKLTENDVIILTISKGKSTTVPNFIGLSKTNIQSKCQGANLTCSFTYGGYTESTKRDISIKQSHSSNSTVSEGTNILITLSSGIYEKVNVPNFINKSKSEITSICNNLGIKCNFNYSNSFSDTPKDNALSQNKSGTVIKGSSVDITLSIGPAKTYTVVIDGSLLSGGNAEQTKRTLQTKLQNACPGVTFNFTFQTANSGIGYLNPNSQVKVGSNTFIQGKTYNVIINSN